MLAHTTCEVCNENSWQKLGIRTYTKATQQAHRPQIQKRYKVLFDKWFPEQQAATLTSVMCSTCGLIIYLPRPEEADIDAKYQYLEELGQDYGQSPYNSKVESWRAKNIYQYLTNYIDMADVHRVLDYGGGDGRLMQAFCDASKECYLIDYNKNCIPGVKKLADTIDDIASSERFDLIICSHVIEHVSQPLKVVEKLLSQLRVGGTILIEVPMEVWRKAPLFVEPVTHINFFTPNSLHNLLRLAGTNVLQCELSSCPHPSGIERHGIRGVGQKTPSTTPDAEVTFFAPDAPTYLTPTILRTVRYHLSVPRKIPKAILRRLGNLGKQ